ncbi:MAG: hypothetical protein A3I05_07425 [Deltaproteobacteria bacterium RIFCSPLOWO2_02_FULL_44_10]|nr:MAG: hypothetical protein A3C46_01975 [Deltaproteobacteria bacterium RIFCSPHIGHO2_02_FULL_44_16]OGQ45663.1 MAG: hypothetical protein A3I05_07425 [Deltaproteobacteria bacterium RIFCSPLOWO2_02_FULL_44_10]
MTFDVDHGILFIMQTKKNTISLFKDLLSQTQKATAKRAFAALRKMRGKINLRIDLKKFRKDR